MGVCIPSLVLWLSCNVPVFLNTGTYKLLYNSNIKIFIIVPKTSHKIILWDVLKII